MQQATIISQVSKQCRWCKAEMESRNQSFLICPNCGAEDHPPIDTPRQFMKAVRKAAENSQYISRAFQGMGSIPPGGSRKSGKSSAKEKMKKPSHQLLYTRLFKQT